MRINGFLSLLIMIVLFFVLISFAITLLPYVLLLWGGWYLYARLIRPAWNRMTQDSSSEPSVHRDVPQETPVMDQQVKSVKDEEFFHQNHQVVEVDYEEKNQ